MKNQNKGFFTSIFPMLAAVLLLQSCATFSFYYPQKAFQPLMDKKFDLQADAGRMSTKEFIGYTGNAGFAFSKHSFIHLGGDFGANSNNYNTNININDSLVKRNVNIKSKINQVRIGYGYYNSVLPKLSIGAQVSLGMGMVNYKSYDKDSNGIQNGERATQFANVTLGLFATFHVEHFDFSFMPNYVNSGFTTVTNNALIAKGTFYQKDMDNIKANGRNSYFQPAFQVNYGLKHVKIFANYTMNSKVAGGTFNYEKYNFSFGVVAKLNLIPTKN